MSGNRRVLSSLVACLAGALSAGPVGAQHAFVRVHVIDVGQADAILVRTPNAQWVLIDGGQSGPLADSLPTQFGVGRLRLLVASHRHKDHIGALDDIVRAVSVDRFVGDTLAYTRGLDDDRLRAALRAKRVAVQPPDADTVTVDSVRFIILPAGDRHADDHENNNSVVVRLEYGQFSMLLAGDAEVERLEWLVEHHPELLEADVLKASHHGSGNGTSAAWLAAVSPTHVVISAGVDGRYKHPRREAVDAYTSLVGKRRVHCTNRHQTVRVYGYRTGRVRVTRYRPSAKSCIYDGTHY